MAEYSKNIDEGNADDMPFDAPSATDQLINSNQVQAEVNPMQDYANLLAQYHGNSSPQLSTRDVMSPTNAYEQQVLGDQQQYTGNVGPQSFSTYYPSMENNINKGSYTGSMIGSNPIYAPSGLYPYGLVDARQKALKDAADKKAAEMDAFKNKIQSQHPKQSLHKAVNPQINEMFYKGLSDWQKKAEQDNPGKDPNKALWSNPKFHQWMDSINALSEYEDQGAKAVAQYEHDIKDGKHVDTPEGRQILNDWYSGKHGTLAFDPENFDKVGASNVFKLNALRDADQLANEAAQNIKLDVNDKVYTDPGSTYDKIITTRDKSVDAVRLRSETENYYKNHFQGRSDAPSYETFAKMVSSRIAHEHTVKTQIVDNDNSKKGLGFQMTAADLKDGETEIISSAGNGKKGTFGIQDYYPLPAGVKPFEMAGTTKIMDIEGKESGTGKMIGNRQVIPSGVGNVYKIHKPGDKNDGKAIKESQIDQFKNEGYDIKVTPVAILTVLGENKNDPDHTVTAEIDDVSNGVEQRGKDGKYVGGVNTDVLKSRAAERQKEINSKSNLPSATKEEWLQAGWNEDQINQGIKLGKIHVK